MSLRHGTTPSQTDYTYQVFESARSLFIMGRGINGKCADTVFVRRTLCNRGIKRRTFLKQTAGAAIGTLGLPLFIPSRALGKAGSHAAQRAHHDGLDRLWAAWARTTCGPSWPSPTSRSWPSATWSTPTTSTGTGTRRAGTASLVRTRARPQDRRGGVRPEEPLRQLQGLRRLRRFPRDHRPRATSTPSA